MEETARQVIAEELRKNDRLVTTGGVITGSVETYILKVLPQDITATIRAVAITELNEQVALDNQPSQIIVDNLPTEKRGIDRAMRRVIMRFQDNEMLLTAIKEIYRLLQQITRLQNPPKNAIVARQNFHLWVNNTDMGVMPSALERVKVADLPANPVLRVVGPLVPYGRKLFWNPIGTSSHMQFYRVKSKKSGVRFLAKRGSSATAPRFKPYRPRTLRKLANKSQRAAMTLQAMMSGAIPPGRTENAGQIVKRIIKRNPSFRGLHFTDGWIEYAPAIGWSKLGDPRVPAFGVMMSKKGRV
jgi:hypothetical protein